MALHEQVRATIEKVGKSTSKRSVKHRSKVAFGLLTHHHPAAVKGCNFQRFYAGVCTHRHKHGLGPKRQRRSKHDRKKAVNPPLAVNDDLQEIEDIVTFLTTNGEILATYEGLKAKMPKGLKIAITANKRPVLALDN